MTAIGIIPARMAASRFPGKPLALLCGHPMIEHVYRRATKAAWLDGVYIATPDLEIYDAATRFGAPVIMTSPAHVRSTDRVAEAAREIAADVVVNIQGDEPLLNPAAIDLLGGAMADATVVCANLVNRITRDDDFQNPNQIKVVRDCRDNVLYMSRRPIPSNGHPGSVRLRQLGIIAFRRDFLATYTALAPTPLEMAESIDVLRVVEHGFSIRTVITPYESFGVDTPDDLSAAEAELADDALMADLFHRRGERR